MMEEEEQKEEETVEDIYQKLKIGNDEKFFTDYMQSVMDNKYRVQIPEPEGSFALFFEGQELMS